MKRLVHFLFFIFLFSMLTGCNGQTKNNPPTQKQNNTKKVVGGGCDGCNSMYIGMPENIAPVDTSIGWKEKGQQLLVTGKVFKIDGKTAAPGVIIYYWQTDNNGYYAAAPGMDEKAKRHGHIRGWVKTDIDGNYSIYTIKPAPYPNADIPAHIHTLIKEPDIGNEYYIDEFIFDDDTLLTAAKRRVLENRGGSGILKPVSAANLQVAQHNITLGLNIPDYPESKHD